jgi:hypothetical protein
MKLYIMKLVYLLNVLQKYRTRVFRLFATSESKTSDSGQNVVVRTVLNHQWASRVTLKKYLALSVSIHQFANLNFNGV